MLVRANLGDCCALHNLDNGTSAWTIKQSVGQGGSNQKADVLKIQQLLNQIDPAQGGPMPPLKEDGWIGPLTVAAIRRFQQFHGLAITGRVEPGSATLAKMNEIPKRTMAQRNTIRLARVCQSMPDLI